MSDRLLELFEREFVAEIERTVVAAFEAESNGVAPFTGDEYIANDPRIRNAAMKITIQALLAQRFFEENAPDWAPTLPISGRQCAKLIDCDDPKQKLRGYYGRSLRWTDWKYRIHPSLGDFGRAVMAARRIPVTWPLQDDFELRTIFFPPRPLAGFSAHDVNWEAPG